jgi:hypothetical protein
MRTKKSLVLTILTLLLLSIFIAGMIGCGDSEKESGTEEKKVEVQKETSDKVTNNKWPPN